MKRRAGLLWLCALGLCARAEAAGADLSMLSDFGRPDITAPYKAGLNGNGHVAGIVQQGSREVARIDQSGGGDNVAMVWQQGVDDLASIEQIGFQNEARILQASGGNAVELLQVGNHNQIAVQQIAGAASASGQQLGSGNQVVLIQDTGARMSFLQQGDANVIQADMPAGLVLRVEQVGNGLYFGLTH